VSEGVEASVSPQVRETVDAVRRLCVGAEGHPVSVTQIASELGIDKSTASRRVGQAIKGGYLKNLEKERGVAAQVGLGDPLPEDIELLPPAEALGEGCCTVALESGGTDEGVSEPETTDEAAQKD